MTAACAVLVTAGLSIGPAAHADDGFTPIWDHGPGGERYVAFGDSFVAGPGIAPQRGGICGRSEHNFPSLVATSLEVTAFTDASCGGAKTTNYWSAQASGSSANPPQLDALSADTTLVTLGTMGGNDVGLVGLATTCVTGDCRGTVGDARYQAIDDLVPVFHQLVADVRDRAPNALLVAVGYGTYLPPESCAALVGITPEEAVYLQGVIDHLSDTIAEVAADEGIAFADMRTVPDAIDHTPCAEPDEQYLRGLITYDDGAQLHPSTLGMQVMAAKVEQTIRDARTSPADQLKAAARTVGVTATCVGQGTARKVRLTATGGKGMATKAVFRVGEKVVGTDRSAPFRIKKSAAPLTRGKAGHGKVSATVTLRYEDLSTTRVVRTARPGCLG